LLHPPPPTPYSYQEGFGTVGEWKDNDPTTAGFSVLFNFFVIHRWQGGSPSVSFMTLEEAVS